MYILVLAPKVGPQSCPTKLLARLHILTLLMKPDLGKVFDPTPFYVSKK